MNAPSSSRRRTGGALLAASAWRRVAIGLLLATSSAVVGCRDVSVDVPSCDSCPPGMVARDSIVVEDTRRDSVFLANDIIVTATTYRETTSFDKESRSNERTTRDTLVHVETVRRMPTRRAYFAMKNVKTAVAETVEVDIVGYTTMSVVDGDGKAPSHLEFTTVIPVARHMTYDKYGPHGWELLYINIVRSSFRLVPAYRLHDDPAFGSGAAVTLRDLHMETGDVVNGRRTEGEFVIRSVDTRRRMISATFEGRFNVPSFGGPVEPFDVRVDFRLSY